METAFITIVALLASASLFPHLWLGLVRNPAVGIATVGAPLLFDLVIDLPTMEFLGWRLDLATDPAGLLIFSAGFVRHLKAPRRAAAWITAGFVAMFILALGRGIWEYGLSGDLAFSGALVLLGGLAYGSSFDLVKDSHRDDVMRSVVWLSMGIVTVIAFRFIGILDDNLIPAPAVVLVAQTGLLVLLVIVEQSRWREVPIAVTLIMIATLMQHRTVWVVTVVGLAFVALRNGRRVHAYLGVLGSLLVIAVFIQVLGFTAPRPEFRADTLVDSMIIAASDDRTLEWRQDYWRYALESHHRRGIAATIAGSGFGAPWITFGPLVDRLEGPHNQYVEIYVRFGWLGLLSWWGLLAWTMYRLWRFRLQGSRTRLSNFGIGLLLLSQIVWSWAYWIDNYQPILLGLAVGAAAGARSTSSNRVAIGPRVLFGSPPELPDSQRVPAVVPRGG